MGSRDNITSAKPGPADDFAGQQAAGVFTWVIASDMIYADEAAAALFGFTPSETRAGLPRYKFRARIHPEDAAHFAAAVEETVRTGLPFQEDYRVCRPDGSCVTVSGFGACFRDEDGTPLYCSGMMVPAATAQPENEMESALDPLVHHCLAAFELAKQRNEPEMMAFLSDALRASLVDALQVTRH